MTNKCWNNSPELATAIITLLSAPEELAGIFEAELNSQRATLGKRVSLGIRGAVVKDAFNDLPRVSTGRSALPPLRSGHTLELVYRIEVRLGTLVELRLAWDDHQGERHIERVSIELPVAPLNECLPDRAEVVQARERLLLARGLREVALLADRGELAGAGQVLTELRHRVAVEGMRCGVVLHTEMQQLRELERRLHRKEGAALSKSARKQSYDKTTGRE